MRAYSDYNIIPIGDHCAISIILKNLNLRCKSYPFDWVSHKEQIYCTNIEYNINIINKLTHDPINTIVNEYIGDALNTNDKINIKNSMWFPHDTELNTDVLTKYERRFNRLKQDLHLKNIFVLLTRHYYIDQDIFQSIVEKLLNYNRSSIILFISGTNHTYFEKINNENVIFKHIEYDISQGFANEYITFRPQITQFLSELFRI